MLCQVESNRFLRTVNLSGINILTNLSNGLTLPQWVPDDHQERTHPPETRRAVWEGGPLAGQGAWTDAQEKRDTRYTRTPEKEADTQRQQAGTRVSLRPVVRQQCHPSGPPMLRAGRRLGLVCTAHHVTLTMHHSVTLCLQQSPCAPISDQLVSQAGFPKLSPCKVSLPPTPITSVSKHGRALQPPCLCSHCPSPEMALQASLEGYLLQEVLPTH